MEPGRINQLILGIDFHIYPHIYASTNSSSSRFDNHTPKAGETMHNPGISSTFRGLGNEVKKRFLCRICG